MGKKVIRSEKNNFSTILGAFIVICFISFFASFVYRFITADKPDATKRWCQNCNTYHDISEQVEDEIWCENCKTWHAPRDESAKPSIK